MSEETREPADQCLAPSLVSPAEFLGFDSGYVYTTAGPLETGWCASEALPFAVPVEAGIQIHVAAKSY